MTDLRRRALDAINRYDNRPTPNWRPDLDEAYNVKDDLPDPDAAYVQSLWIQINKLWMSPSTAQQDRLRKIVVAHRERIA